jgi:molybdopterin/thiamine biosynthesis adenylyltransferase
MAEQKVVEEKKERKLNLSRQSKLVPAEELVKWNLEIYGVGSVGGYVAKILAKVGFRNMSIFDMDNVEEENIGPQVYDFRHLKKTKVEALKEIIKESAGIDVKAVHGQVTEKTKITAEPNTIYLCFFDSIEGRQLVYNKIKDMPCIFVDGRIGRFDMRHYLFDCSDEKQRKEYLKTLPKKEGSDLICGEKASAMINYEIAGRIANNVVNFVAGREYDKIFIGNVTDPNNDLHIRIERKKK